MMGDDVSHDGGFECEVHRAGIIAMRRRAAELRAELCAVRGLAPSQACDICCVPGASPAHCEQCTGVHGAGMHHPAAACSPQAVAVGSGPHCVRRQACRCGPDGCADGACPGRPA